MGITKTTIDSPLGHRGFYDMYRIDLMAEAERLARESGHE